MSTSKPTSDMSWAWGGGSVRTDPGAIAKMQGWDALDYVPFDWLNWRWYEENEWRNYLDVIGDSFLDEHYHDATATGGDNIQGYHRQINQILDPLLTETRVLLRQVVNNSTGTNTVVYREYRDAAGASPRSWTTINARWDLATSRWIQDNAAINSVAIYWGHDGTCGFVTRGAGLGNWTDAQWESTLVVVTDGVLPFPGSGGWIQIQNAYTAYTHTSDTTGDLILSSGRKAASTHGLLYLPTNDNDENPTGVPAHGAIVPNVAITTERLRRRLWFYDPLSSAWVSRPYSPTTVRVTGTSGQKQPDNTQMAIDFVTMASDVKSWDAPGTNRFYLAGDHAITGVNVGAKKFTIAGNYAALFPASSYFTVYGSTGNDAYNWCVDTATDVGGNTEIVVVAAIPDATVDGRLCGTKFIADGDMVVRISCRVEFTISGIGTTNDAQNVLWIAVNGGTTRSNMDLLSTLGALTLGNGHTYQLHGSLLVKLSAGDTLQIMTTWVDNAATNAIIYDISAWDNYCEIEEI